MVLHPFVAKSPPVMAGGAEQRYAWRVTGRTLQLSGPVGAGASTYVLEREE